MMTADRSRRLQHVFAELTGMALVFAAACGPPETSSNELTEQGRNAIQDWLFCDDCRAGERDSVRALGNAAVPFLGSALRRIPDHWRSNMRSRYLEAASRAQLHNNDSVLYVEFHLANFDAAVQSRSGFSLGDIKTAQAIDTLRNALRDSLANGYRADVIRDLHHALLTATAARLDNQARMAAFLDTLWVSRAGNVPWDGDETVTLKGAPFERDVMVGFRSSAAELGFVAAALPGEYAFSVANVGTRDSQYFGALRITSFPAAPIAFIPDVTSGPFPRVFLRSLTRTTSPPDFVHYFRFAPASSLTITAEAVWTGPSQIDLLWDNCSNRSGFAKTPRRISGHVIGSSGEPLGSVSVSLVGTSLSAISAPGGNFEINSVPNGWSGQLRAVRPGFTPVTLEAWEGAGDVVVMVPQPAAAFSARTRHASPNRVSHQIPGGACRLLGVLRSDTTAAPAIVKLSINSP